MLACPGCGSQNVFITRAEPPATTCRNCGTLFSHAASSCPPAAALIALISDQVTNGTYPAGIRDGARLKDYVFWTEAPGLAIPVSPADKYKMIYNMTTLSRFGPYTPDHEKD